MPLSDIDWTNEPRDPRVLLSAWCTTVAGALNGQLPGAGRFAAEIDCRTRPEIAEAAAGVDAPTGAAPTLAVPARFTDRFGVRVTDLTGGRVAAVVLFATLDNKSDSDAALAFAVRAAGFMSAGVGVVIVDPLPGPASWATHLHSLVGVYPIARRPRGGESPVLVVQPETRDGTERFVVWHHGVAPNFPLPTVPVPVSGAPHPKLDLEATYAEACAHLRAAE